MGRQKRENGTTFKTNVGDSSYITKAISEFTIMTNDELKTWEHIKKHMLEKGLRF